MESFINFSASLSDLRNRSSHVWVSGDFNLPGFDWQKNCLKPNCNYPELTNNDVELLADHSLTQTVTEPTRGENILDLLEDRTFP